MREDEFQLYADVIRSDQMPAPDVVALFKEEPEFQKWYQAKYLQDPHEAAMKLERWAERNFQLRTDLMNSPMAEKINKLNEMIKEANETRP